MSGAKGDRPARVRRTTASNRSTIGTIRIETGSSTGSRVGSRLACEPPAPWVISLPENCPDSVTALAESTSPISIEPLSPMNSRAGWKLCGRNPAQAPAKAARQQCAGRGERDAVEVGELVAEQEEGGGADADDAGREAVEAVDEVHGVDGGDDDQHGEQRTLRRVEGELAVGLGREERVLDPGEDQEPGREHLAAELGQRVELEQVVQHADRADHGPGDDHDAGVAEHERSAARQERQLLRHEVRRHQPAEHRQPTEVRDRLRVHVAVADLGHGAGAQRDLAGDDGQEIGDRGGDEEDQDVLPHRRAPLVFVRQGGAERLEHGVQLLEGERSAPQHATLAAR